MNAVVVCYHCGHGGMSVGAGELTSGVFVPILSCMRCGGWSRTHLGRRESFELFLERRKGPVKVTDQRQGAS